MTGKRIGTAFEEVHASEELKNKTIDFLRGRMNEEEKPAVKTEKKNAFIPVLAALAAVICVVTGAGVYKTTVTETAYVSIDVNPSIELCLNKYDKVIRADAYNDDGAAILEGVDVKGDKCADAIDEIINSDAMSAYLGEDARLTVTVACGSKKDEERLRESIDTCESISGHGAYLQTVSSGIAAEAHDCGYTIGKYSAVRELCDENENVSIDSCQDMSMAQIYSEIEKCHEGEGGCEDSGVNSQNDTEGSVGASEDETCSEELDAGICEQSDSTCEEADTGYEECEAYDTHEDGEHHSESEHH